MTTIRTILTALALVAMAASASAQGVDVPAGKSEASKSSPKASAQARLAEWQTSKRKCFESVGLKEGSDWRFHKDNPGKTQVNDNVWLGIKDDKAAQLEKCR